jgi:hypothetical protein
MGSSLLAKMAFPVRISPDVKNIGDFDCGNDDLNDFIRNDACDYLRQLLAVTYLAMDSVHVAAFFSVLNDTLGFDPKNMEPSIRTARNRLVRKIPNAKRLKTFPAVKLGRLGVSVNIQSKGLGREILDWIKMSFVSNNKTGCRFLIVDAYNNSRTLEFYKQNEFEFLLPDDANKDTRLMYFDLKPFHDKIIAVSR